MSHPEGNEAALSKPETSSPETPRATGSQQQQRTICFKEYDLGECYDEMFVRAGVPRRHSRKLVENIEALTTEELLDRQLHAERVLLQKGITVNDEGGQEDVEKILPFDIVPRIIAAKEWGLIELGLTQRTQALNLFLDDIYHEQKILRDGVIPSEVIYSAKSFRPQCVGLQVPHGIWCPITGTDLVRHPDGRIYVLNDNLRCPSGASSVLENRRVMKGLFQKILTQMNIRPVSNYPNQLRNMLQFLANKEIAAPRVVLLTPGPDNWAYFEHSFLAQQMGIELVEGRDLVVEDGVVRMRTTDGLERVDVIYRRIDDDFLDPDCFRDDSVLGVQGLMSACKAGNVALANAPGTGVADDKVVYAYAPRVIQYYLGEEILLPNVPTHICGERADLQYVLEHLGELVVQTANPAGVDGMLVGPHSTRKERATFGEKIRANPGNYIAQPTFGLSQLPTIVGNHIEGRAVDLRAYTLCGKETWVLPGGLTRVANKKGSLDASPFKGGGSKDTWVLGKAPEDEREEASANAVTGREALC